MSVCESRIACFTLAAHPFIRHQISSWPPDLDERSRFLRIRVSWDGPNGPNAQIGPRAQRRIFGPFTCFSPILMFKAFSFTVSYDLTSI